MGELHVEGMSDVLKKLRELPEALHKGVLDPGIRAMASTVAREARRIADQDKKTGKLKKSIQVVRQRGSFGWFYISAGKGCRYAHLVEFGTSPHVIRGRLHPGSRAKSFMRRAFDSTAERALKRGIAIMKRKFRRLKI